MQYLFLDTETTGLYPSTNGILTAYFVPVTIINHEVTVDYENELNISIEYPKGQMPEVSPKALEINGIDLKTFKGTHSPKEVVDAMVKLKKLLSPSEPMCVSGHNVKFDRGFLRELFKQQGKDFSQYFVDNLEGDKDTMLIAKRLQKDGHLKKMSNKLTTLTSYFGISGGEGDAHEARYDVIASIKLLEKFYEIGVEAYSHG